jgi:competence protein ComEC
MILKGIVTSSPIKEGAKLEFDFYTSKYGKVLLTADNSYLKYIIPANKLQLKVKIIKPHEFDNTNAFNYAGFLKHKNIVAVGRVVTHSKIDYLGTAISYLPKRLRYNLANYLDKALENYKAKPMMLALLIGEKSFSEQEKQLFIDSGTSHLMVISGLHVGLLALIAFVIARIVWSLSPRLCRKVPAQYIAIIFSIFTAFLYSLIAGFSLPTQRAVIMVLVVGIFWLAKKRVPISRSLVIAFMIIIFMDWQSVYSSSLWLSFSAVFFLVMIAIVLQQYKSKLVLNLSAQFYLTIFLIPISVYFFAGFSIVSFIANLVAIPLVSLLIVPLLLLSLVCSFVGISIWFLPGFLLDALIDYLNFLVNSVGLVEYWTYFSFASLIIVLIGISLVILPLGKPLKLLGLALCLVFFQHGENAIDEYDAFDLHIFDSRYNIVLIQDDDQNLLYLPAEALTDSYTLENIIQGYLTYHNVKQVDNLVISGKAKEKVSLELLKNIIPIENVISNIDFANRDKPCSYSENFSLGKSEVRFFGIENSCNISITLYGNETLILGEMNKSQQSKFKALYMRMLQPKILISNKTLLEDLKPDYYVYSGDKSMSNKYFNMLRGEGVKVLDTYNNGAISLRYNNESKMSFESELKSY